MEQSLFKYSGAGNVFVVLDGRGGGVDIWRQPSTISDICARTATDGIMILDEAPGYDFGMEFYNPDGSGGMMCGNGGRCIVAFADYLGIKGAEGRSYRFLAPDGVHTATILEGSGEDCTVRLRMKDTQGIKEVLGGWFLNTGTRHFVKFVEDVEKVDVDLEGKFLRWRQEFAPEGSNVNFVSVGPDAIHVRTFEKGVERETLACGTGITASALTACHVGVAPSKEEDGRVEYRIRARQDMLQVDFKPAGPDSFEDIYLTGPAKQLQILQ
ncbi:MAG: diaminopimelate epimerase [Bacteroidales bacterium]|nr:diaminopimelate epimerase [Bacteroidales bacterium]